MAEFEGPWSRPPAGPTSPTDPAGAKPPTSKPRLQRFGLQPPGASSDGPKGGFPLGLALWLGLLATAVAVIIGLTKLFPTAAPKPDNPDIWYLFGLLALVSSALIGLRRFDLTSTVRNLAAWVAIFAVVLVGYTFRGDLAAAGARLRSAINPEFAAAGAKGEAVIGRSVGGSFFVNGAVNGQPARFLVDTGASDIVLTQEDAARAGLHLDPKQFSDPNETANGVGYGAPVVVNSLTVGSIHLRNVPVQVNKAPMSASLLGMTFLKRLASFEVKGDQLILRGR